METKRRMAMGLVVLTALFGLSACVLTLGDGNKEGDGDGNGGGGGGCATFADAYGSKIDSDTVVEAGSCVNVESSVIVRDGTLTIEAGATLSFAEKTFLAVTNGALDVNGTADEKVTFTGSTQQPGWWVGLVMQATDRAANSIQHAVIEYAGHERDPFSASFCLHCDHNPSNLQLVGARGAVKVGIDNVTIRHGAAAGLFTDGGVEITSFKNNKFASNEGGAARIHARNIGDLDASSSFGSDVRVSGGQVDSGEEITWPAIDANYLAEGNIEIRGEDTKVTVEGGATFEFDEQKYMTVSGGVFVAAGTADNKVTFTGSSKQKGWWSGITFHQTDRLGNKLEHTVIEYGGNDNGPFRAAFCLHCDHHPSNLQLHGARGAVTLTLNNVQLRSSSAAGIYLDGNTTIKGCSGLELSGNAEAIAVDKMATEATLKSTCSL